MTSTENHTNVFQAPVSFKISFQFNTPVKSKSDNAINAVSVASIPIKLPVTHSNKAIAKIAIINASAFEI